MTVIYGFHGNERSYNMPLVSHDDMFAKEWPQDTKRAFTTSILPKMTSRTFLDNSYPVQL